MDQQKLRSLVFEKTGVRIDVDDPIFALVALNEAVLAEAVERHITLLDDATGALSTQLQALQGGAPVAAPAQQRAAAPAAPASTTATAAPAPAAGAEPLARPTLFAVAGGAALASALLVVAGQAVLSKPAPAAAPAPIVQARELTAEQNAALRRADKLDKIVQKLDAKTRAAIASELQKP